MSAADDLAAAVHATRDAVFSFSHESITVADATGAIVEANPAFGDACGVDCESVRGEPWWFNVIESDGFSAGVLGEVESALSDAGQWQGELWRRHADGEPYVESSRVVLVKSGSELRIVCIGVRTSGSERAQKLVRWQLNHDALTKLPNRLLFRERLSRFLSRAAQENELGAVLFIGIDRFKYVNDLLGHEGGDRVLVEVAHRIAMTVREADTVARLGGDEFGVVLHGVQSSNEVEAFARRLLDVLGKPFNVGGHELAASATIGVAMVPADGNDADQLTHKADSALRRSKERGRSQFLFFEDEMNARAARHLEIESHLRKALKRDQMELHYQPVIDLNTGRVSSVEALLRWNHPDWGRVSPVDFIPVAEDSGLIVPIGAWIIEEVAQRIKAWDSVGESGFRVAINISARQLTHERNVADLTRLLAQQDATRLTLEITESLLMHETDLVQRFIDEVRGMGIKVALDDFGTGYSALGYLRRFEMDVLKIDKSFVDDIDADLGDLSLVATIISMGRTMGLRVVAEGVETHRQLDYLRSLGCDLVQGYLFSRPVAADQLLDVIRELEGRDFAAAVN